MNARKQPPRQRRPVFVQYVYSRLCRHNPSWDRFRQLEPFTQDELLAFMERRHGKRLTNTVRTHLGRRRGRNG